MTFPDTFPDTLPPLSSYTRFFMNQSLIERLEKHIGPREQWK